MRTIIILLVGLSILNQSCINQKVTQSEVFNPTKEYELSSNYYFERNFIDVSDSIRLESWYASENNAQFNLIYLSGNGSNIRSAVPFFNELSNTFNLNIFSFNYRGYGQSSGTPSIEGIIQDGQAALKYYENEIGNKELPTLIIGYSLGGFVTLNIANNDIIDKVILLSTFTSLEELEDYLIKEALPGIIRPFLKLDIDHSIYKLDNTELVKTIDKPILFIHGKEDEFIPPSMSYSLYNFSTSDNKWIKTIPNADHRMVLKDYESNKLVIKEIQDFMNL